MILDGVAQSSHDLVNSGREAMKMVRLIENSLPRATKHLEPDLLTAMASPEKPRNCSLEGIVKLSS